MCSKEVQVDQAPKLSFGEARTKLQSLRAGVSAASAGSTGVDDDPANPSHSASTGSSSSSLVSRFAADVAADFQDERSRL